MLTLEASRPSICFFANCEHPALAGSTKCSIHRHRTKCMVDFCSNQVYARNLCVRHGGKKKCRFEDCQLNARIGEFCSKHGGKSSKAICTHEGCTKQAHKRKKCVRHGGGRKCNIEGCDVHARRGGFCARHGRQISNGKVPQVSSPASTIKDEELAPAQALKSLHDSMQREAVQYPHYPSNYNSYPVAKYPSPQRIPSIPRFPTLPELRRPDVHVSEPTLYLPPSKSILLPVPQNFYHHGIVPTMPSVSYGPPMPLPRYRVHETA